MFRQGGLLAYLRMARRAKLATMSERLGYDVKSVEGDPRFREVEESVAWIMRFPSGGIAKPFDRLRHP